MNSGYKVSIIVPIYNLEKYIERCLDTLLGQSYKNIEVIAVIDGGVDRSSLICKNRQLVDNRVIVIEQENAGVSVARNTGIKAATGDFLMFVDGDDWIEPNMVEVMLGTIIENKTDACFCNCYYRNDNDVCVATSIEGVEQLAFSVLKAHLRYGFIASPCLSIINAKIAKKLFFDVTIHALEDWEYNFRLLTQMNKISVIATPLYHYREVLGSASNSPLNDKKLTCFYIIDRVHEYINCNGYELQEEGKYVPVFLLNHMLVILSNSSYSAKEALTLRSYARKMLGYSIVGKNIPFRQRVYIWMAAISPRVFYYTYNLKYRGRI